MKKVCGICGAAVLNENEDGSLEMERHSTLCASGHGPIVMLVDVPDDWERPPEHTYIGDSAYARYLLGELWH